MNNGLRWNLYAQFPPGSEQSVLTTTAYKTNWNRFSIDVSPSGVAAEYGSASSTLASKPPGPIASFRLQVGPYNPPASGGIRMHVDDVICTTH
jgi:hypothetical protein